MRTNSIDVEFAGKIIGDGHPCFITFEAGPTHDGLESAQRLAKLAAEAGADAIKFQLLDPERLMADPEVPFSYEVLVDRASGKTRKVEEPLYDLLKRRALEPDEWCRLKRYCDELDLVFFATAAFEEEVDFLVELGCQSIKIASADLNHYSLISHVASTGVCLQIDTGNGSLGEIETAVDLIRDSGNERIIIHHCPSGYPARLPGINLRVIPTLREMFPYPIAFSDHSPGWDMDIAAVAMGANLIEKTISEDRTTPSIEHIMSIESDEMVEFVNLMNDLQIAMGSPRRILHDQERKNRLIARRSAFLATDAKAGTRLADLEVDFRRPGYGIGPDFFELLKDTTLKRDLAAGERVELTDLVM